MPERPLHPPFTSPPLVLIAGAGVAALEAAIGLRRLVSGDEVEIELLTPAEHFCYRPLAILEPFTQEPTWRLELSRFGADHDVGLRRGLLGWVDAERHAAGTTDGHEMSYTVLLIAAGARGRRWLEGACTFGLDAVRPALARAERGEAERLAFAFPPGPTWPLPLYELALLTSAHLRRRGVLAELALVAPEREPLEAFGPRASAAVAERLREYGVAFHGGRRVAGYADGRLALEPGATALGADEVVTLPALAGPDLPGTPRDRDGFVLVDEHGCAGEDVYAAGDAVSSALKHGGLACRQADAAAEAILARLGLPVVPQPFRPVVEGVLYSAGPPLYAHADPVRGSDAAQTWSLWWPPGKLAGRHLGAYLHTVAGAPRAPEQRPDADVIEVEAAA